MRPHVSSANLSTLPLPDHRHRLVACQRSSCGMETAEAKPWSDQAFHAPMVLFQYVVEVLALSWPRASAQLAALFHLLDGAWVGRVLAHGDGARVHRMRLVQRVAEEPLAAPASRLAESRKSIVWPRLSTARHR